MYRMRCAILIMIISSIVACGPSRLPTDTAPIQTIAQNTISPDREMDLSPDERDTSTPSTNSTPELLANWCPQGRPILEKASARVAYSTPKWSDEVGIWVWDQGKQSVRIVDVDNVLWLDISPEGDWIVYLSGDYDTAVEVRAVKTDGSQNQLVLNTNELQKVANTGVDILYPCRRVTAWIPGSSALLFRICSTKTGEREVEFDRKIWKVGASTGETTLFGVGDFVVSPNGEYVILMEEGRVDIYRSEGGIFRIDVLQEIDFLLGEAHRSILRSHWSLDGSNLLVIQAESGNVKDEEATFDVHRVWIDERPSEFLGSYSGYVYAVDFSPDNRFMFYSHMIDFENNSSEMHLVNLDSGEEIVYLEGRHIGLYEWSSNAYDFTFVDGLDTYLSNICRSPDQAELLRVPNSTIDYSWVCADTLLVGERVEAWWLSFEIVGDSDGRSDFHLAEFYDSVCVQGE